MLEVNKSFIKTVRDQIDEGQDSQLSTVLADLHHADVAEVMNSLRTEEASYLFRLVESEAKAEIITNLTDELRHDLLEAMTAAEIADEVIKGLQSDDAADMMAELHAGKIEEVMKLVDDAEQASDIRDLLGYAEGTAGAIMAKELVQVQGSWSVGHAIREIRKQAEDLDHVYTIYVTDEWGMLTGRLSLKRLLLDAPSTRSLIEDLKHADDIIQIGADEDEDRAVKLMERYDLVALPVVDGENRLIGRITIDDAVDVIIEDAERDYQLASGISEDVESRDNVWTITRARLPWLLIGLVGGIGGAYVIGAFDMEQNPGMVLFIPLIAAMGGNVGVQSAAIVVQSLASQGIATIDLFTRLSKELVVGLINGIICACIILGTSLVLGFGLALSITVSIALLCVIVFAALFGAFVPLMLDKRNIDPALATGPFITTANDIIGLMIYFAVGSAIAGFFP
jgi:magnesium transporter